MRILITGCGGMLGEAVYREFSANHQVFASDINLNETWLSHLDVRDPEQVKIGIDEAEPDAIIHLAALTDMEYCELHPQEANQTNAIGTLNVLSEASKWRLPVAYISSAGIFGGEKDCFTEEDTPNPLNAYARTKYRGELLAMSYPRSIVVRAGWMMGGGPAKDKKFINKMVKQIQGGAKDIYVVRDKLGTPTYTYHLASLLRELVENSRYGLYHGTCTGGGSRVDVAKALLSGLGLNGNVKLHEVESDYFKTEYFATRPASEKLVSIKINHAPDWRDCLKDYLERFKWL